MPDVEPSLTRPKASTTRAETIDERERQMNQDPNTSDPVVVEVRAADPYPVVIGRGLLPEILEECSSSRTVAIFYQPPLAQTAETLREKLAEAGVDVEVLR